MTLPEDIRLKIEKSVDKEEVLQVVTRLQRDNVSITHDVYAAIMATLEEMKLGVLE